MICLFVFTQRIKSCPGGGGTRPFNPITQDTEESGSEFEGSLVYRVNFRTAKATRRNHVLKNKRTNKQIKSFGD